MNTFSKRKVVTFIQSKRVRMDSDDIFQRINQCYKILANSEGDQQVIIQITTFLTEFYQQPNAFPFLIDYISKATDEIMYQGAITGIGAILRQTPDILDDPDLLNLLLQLTIFPQSNFVRRNSIFYISKYRVSTTAQLIIQFIQANFANESDINVETFMKLLSIVREIIPEENFREILELCCNLSNKSLQSSNADLISSGVIFKLDFIEYIDPETPIYAEYLQSTLEVLTQLLNAATFSENLSKLIDSMITLLSNNPQSIDYHILLQLCITYMTMPEYPFENVTLLFYFSDKILMECQQLLIMDDNSREIYKTLLSAYVLYAKRSYDSNETYDQSIYYTFVNSPLFHQFTDQEFIETVYSKIPELFHESSAGKFTSLLILESTFESYGDFYQSKFNELYSLLDAAMDDSDLCVRSTASMVISDFCNLLEPPIQFDSIVGSLILSFIGIQEIEFIDALTEIFEISSQTDSYFDQCCQFLFESLSSFTDVLIRQKIIRAIAALTKHSRERSCVFFEQIFQVMSQIYQETTAHPEDETISLLKPSSIACLSYLCISCTRQIECFIPTFVESITSNLNDVSCKFDCIKAISIVCHYFTDQARSIVVPVLTELFTIATTEIEITDATDEIYDESDDEMDDDQFSLQKSFAASAAAVCAICELFSIYPELLVEHFDKCFDVLNQCYKSGYMSLACAKGLIYIAKALINLSDRETQEIKIINELLVPLINSGDSDNSSCGKVLVALSIFVNKNPAFGSQVAFDALNKIFHGELYFQRGEITYHKVLFDGIYCLLKALMKSDLLESINLYIPIIQEYVSSHSHGLRDFALMFFGSYCTEYSEVLTNDLKVKVLQAALSVNEGYASIDCIKKFVKSIPKEIGEAVPSIIAMIKNRLEANKGETIIVEKCVLLCRSLMNSMGVDISEFVSIIIQSTPPTVLIKKTHYFLELLIAIASKQEPTLMEPIAYSLIHMFSESDCLLGQRELTEQQIAQAKATLLSIAAGVQDFNQFCSKVCNEDQFKLTNLQNRLSTPQ